MAERSLVHLSDLHLGRSARTDAAAAALCRKLVARDVDHVVISGDVTHRGLDSEMDRFRGLFHPLLAEGRVTVVPGNHDRAGDDAGAQLMGQERVRRSRTPGVCLVQVDSTAPHNRSLIKSHGEICDRVQSQVDQALGSATPGELVVLTLHHHLLPLPTETLAERFALGMGWPFASELVLGSELLRRARGRCDLVLHGHRHVPREVKPWPADLRPLTIYNAGSSTEMGGGRLFLHQEGRLLGSPEWLGVELPRRGRVGAAVPEPSFTPA